MDGTTITAAIVAVFLNGKGGASVALPTASLDACKKIVTGLMYADRLTMFSRGHCVETDTGRVHHYVIVPNGMGRKCWHITDGTAENLNRQMLCRD